MSLVLDFFIFYIRCFYLIGFGLVEIGKAIIRFFSPKIRVFLEKLLDMDFDIYVFRIIENLPYAFFIFFLGFLGVFTLAKYSEKYIYVRISTITTGSMYPTISPGSVVISTPTSEFKVGDIITYREINEKTGLATGRAITHRIIAKKDNYFITKGDANENPDALFVSKGQILGKINFIIPYLGFLDIAVKNPVGFLTLVAIPAFVLLKDQIEFLRTEVFKTKKERFLF